MATHSITELHEQHTKAVLAHASAHIEWQTLVKRALAAEHRCEAARKTRDRHFETLTVALASEKEP